MAINQNNPIVLASGVLAAYIIYRVLQTIYRLYFHPLNAFRGPSSARLSEAWFADLASSGFAERTLDVYHERYDTTALRAAPNRLHISDPDVYKTIYNQTQPFPKYKDYYDTYNTPHSLFTECDPVRHRELRKRLSPLFSRSGVVKLEPLLHDKMRVMTDKIARIHRKGPVEVNHALRCLTVDIISEFAFSKSLDLLNEKEDSFDARFLVAFDDSVDLPVKAYYNPIHRLINKYIPLPVVAKFSHTAYLLNEIIQTAAEGVKTYKTLASDTTSTNSKSKYPVLFDHMEGLPDSALLLEGMDMLVAGSDTTAWTLTIALFQILQNPAIKKRMEEVARELLPDPERIPSYTELERHEYLAAVVKEALRVASPVPGSLPRIVPKEISFELEGKVVPPGTIISMSSHTMHTSSDIWGPDVHVFNPDRWLQGRAKSLEQYFVPFSKGTRACIGINLAYAEVTVTLTYLFRLFDMKLVTKKIWTREMFIQMPEPPCCLVEFAPWSA